MALILPTAKRAAGCWALVLALVAFLTGSCAAPDVNGSLEPRPRIHEVEIKKFQFKPATLTIRRGDSVRWVNRDMVPHHVADTRQKQWQSHDMGPEDFFSTPIKDSTAYICTLHPGMQASIVVQDY